MSRRATILVQAIFVVAAFATSVSWPGEEPTVEAYPHGGLEEDCALCHSSGAWRPSRISPEFEHAKFGFSLIATHRQADCRACHATLEFDRADPACVACHLDVHQDELGTDCGECHTPRSFIDRSAMVRRHLMTRFPLDGSHRATDCEDCHVPVAPGRMQFVNTPIECVDCHLDEYLATTEPDHAAAGFPRSCENCHDTRIWASGSFLHSRLPPGFDCVNCHLDDFLETTEPDHQAAGFPQDCDACHSTRSWIPAIAVDHDPLYFPIYSGKHRGAWSACQDCHMNPGDFSSFTCIDCHEHDDEVDVTNKHEDVSDFSYDSQACYSCHPDGSD